MLRSEKKNTLRERNQLGLKLGKSNKRSMKYPHQSGWEQSGFDISGEMALHAIEAPPDPFCVLNQQTNILLQKLENILESGFDIIRYAPQGHGS